MSTETRITSSGFLKHQKVKAPFVDESKYSYPELSVKLSSRDTSFCWSVEVEESASCRVSLGH